MKPEYLRDAEPVSTVEPSVLEDCRPICGSREGRCAGAKSAIITPEEQMWRGGSPLEHFPIKRSGEIMPAFIGGKLLEQLVDPGP